MDRHRYDRADRDRVDAHSAGITQPKHRGLLGCYVCVIEPTGLPSMVDPAREDSFESFFRSSYGSVVRALVIVAGSESEAEDLAQEAFARALERWDRVRSMASPIGYVYRIAFNLNRNRLRHVARGLRRRSEPAPEPDPASEAETRSEIRRVLAALPASQREALVLVEWLGLDAAEAGRVLKIDAASVRGRIHRARRTIAKQLGEQDE